jgi:hypothetical protein
MATRKNDDGTISFINADPPLSGLICGDELAYFCTIF